MAKKNVRVKSYRKKDGTTVKAHVREVNSNIVNRSIIPIKGLKPVEVIRSFTMEDWWDNLSDKQKEKILHDKFGMTGNELISCAMDDWEDFYNTNKRIANILIDEKFQRDT